MGSAKTDLVALGFLKTPTKRKKKAVPTTC